MSSDPGEDEPYESEWGSLPIILVEEIFAYLGWKDRLSAALVCHNWTPAFYSPHLWRRLVVTPRLFTRSRFHVYGGYRDEISHRLVQKYLGQIGDAINDIRILPNSNYFNLYGFIQVLFNFLEFFDEYPMPSLKRFEFTFNCENETPMGRQISGTGGHILEGLQRLLHDMQGLKHLSYNQLLLNTRDVHGVLEDLLIHNKTSLKHLELVNFTNARYPLFPLVQFKALHTLVISPLNVTGEIAIMLAERTPLKRLVIVQDNYTPETELEPVPLAAWWQVKELAPELRVRLSLRGRAGLDVEILIQENAPVDQVISSSPYSTTKLSSVLSLVDEYRASLGLYASYGLPRTHGPRGFSSRADSALVLLIRECQRLHTLIIRERISTATLLLLAYEGRNRKPASLNHLCVRRNAMLRRCDWPRAPDWSDEFWAWLRKTSRDYERTQSEVARLMGDENWCMLSDKQFKALQPPD